MPEDVVLDFPSPLLPARHARSTLLHGSFASLKGAGHWDVYAGAVSKEALETIQTSVAGMWLPLDVAAAHYAACDLLGLSAESALRMGRGTFAHTKSLLLGTALALAKGAGVTPWSVMPHLQRFWMRGFDGGGIRVLREGPKEAHVDLAECPLLASHFFRNSLRGVFTSVVELVCAKAYLHERPVIRPETTVSFRVQWA